MDAANAVDAAVETALETGAELQRLLGDRLRVALLYGSAARGEYISGVSDINLLAILDDVDTSALIAAAPHAKRMEQRRINLLVLEWADRDRLSDTFCIELLDLRDACVPLIGENPFADAVVDAGLLRRQAEREARTRLLHLHAGMLHAMADRRSLGGMLRDAVPSFATYLRAALRLSARPVPRLMGNVIGTGCSLIGADPQGLLAANEARTNARSWDVEVSDPIVETYRSACEQIVRFIDTFEGGGAE
jgi:predicted nucleotidyltransferase